MSETRALSAALSGPVFHGAATRSALHASERHIERFAPEGPKATRAGSLRTLGFADRIAAPWMAAAMESRGAKMMAQPMTERQTPSVSWVLPRPWFQDELDWMAAARVRAEQSPQYLTTRGTYEAARSSASDVAMPMVSADMVAPSMATYGMPPGFAGSTGTMDEGYGQVHHGLRAYSPMVPFAATAAAEVVAGTIGLAQRSGMASVAGAAGRSPILSALAVVAPSAMAPSRSALAQPSAFAPEPTPFAQPSAPAETYRTEAREAAPPPTPSHTRALIDAARAAVGRVDDVRHAPAPTAQPVATDTSQPAVSGEAPAAAPSIAASSSELALADAATSSPQIARALRTVDLLLSASAPTAPTVEQPAPLSAFAPSAGPRVSMPAGLGGLITALDAQHTTTHPMARVGGMPSAAPFAPALAASARALEMPFARAQMPGTAMPGVAASGDAAAPAMRDVPGFAPVWATPATALGAISADRARGVDHVAWSDRWLARFVGASPVALASLDVALDHAARPAVGSTRAYDVASPEMTYLRPPMMSAPALAAAIRGSSEIQPLDAPVAARAAAPAAGAALSPDRALRIDDNEAVSDDIFAAIAAAPVARARPPLAAPTVERPAERIFVEPRSLTPADVVRAGSRPTIADLVSIAPPPAPGAGLSPGLASSPMAPAMAAMLPLPAAPIFDTRALYPESLGSAYLGGLLSRSAAPIGVVSSTPTMSALVAAAGVGGAAPGGAFASAPGSLPFVGAFAGLSSAMRDARQWSTGDLAIAPSSLRLAESAPERVVLATEQARRATGPTPFAAVSAAEAAMFGMPAPTAARALPPTAAPSAPELQPPAPSPAASTDVAAAETTAPVPAAATTAAASSLDGELAGLRAALLAGGATSVPLAFAEYLPMLSAAMAAPFAPTAPDAAPSATTAPGVTSVAAAASPMAAGELSLPFVTSAAPGARSFAMPAVGGITTAMQAPAASRFFADDADTATPSTPMHPGALGARDSLSSFVALHSPVAATSTGRPGALAENILSWSVAEERAVTDLSFDFVAPEMVLAAKVYGLSPGAAAQAARLAVAGPSAIASLATSIDLTFLRGFQQVHAQHGAAAGPFAQRAAAPGAPTAPPEYALAPDSTPIETPATAAAPTIAPQPTSAPSAAYAAAAAAEDAAAFAPPPMPSIAGSVLSSSRLPRGAFLWPEATVAALGLRALSPEGVAGMPVVALELLAAAAVADLGTWVTAFPTADQATIANVIRGYGLGGGTVPTAATTPGPGAMMSPGAMTMLAPPLPAARAGAPSATTSLAAPGDALDADMPPELGGAPQDIRARFEAIYVALARSSDAVTLSPSARAARAMALLAREDGGQSSARERALAAWTMLPNVYQGGMDFVAPRDGAAASDEPAETRPGLASLAARAGESLGSFVSPSAREVSGWSGDEFVAGSSLAARAEMPVYVNTAATPASAPSSSSSSSSSSSAASALSRPGRAFAQAGGGEPEIPAWFEAAARRMLDDRSPGAGMSLAELVLVTAAATPSKAIAASPRGSSSGGGSSSPVISGTAGGKGAKPDIDQLALEVFQEVMRLIDIARERSGDPYQ